jgi:hypothetical protein
MIHSSTVPAIVSVKELLHGILNDVKMDASVNAMNRLYKSVQRRVGEKMCPELIFVWKIEEKYKHRTSNKLLGTCVIIFR